ncbi:hypothetical protein BJX65DRAFT_312017 [Aspergillus insuetus]
MVRLSLLSLATTLGLAAASKASETSKTSIRIDDLVVLDGAVLKFNPIDGLNETTRDPEWQHNYLKSVLDYEFYEENELQESHLDKRYSGESICFTCMIHHIQIGRVQGLFVTRTSVLGTCFRYCGAYTLATMADNAAQWGVEVFGRWYHGTKEYNLWEGVAES